MRRNKNHLRWLIPLLLVISMTGCWGNRTGITSPPAITLPTVSSTNPVNADTDVAFNQKIAATFSEAMDASTITTATFTVMQGTSFVSGTVSYSGTTAIFKPSSNLAPNTVYTVTITTGAKDPASNSLASNYVWIFTTGAAAVVTPPTVTSTNPDSAATGVGLNQKIAATFSRAMDATTITASTFTLKQGTTSVSGFVSYSGTTAIFAPSSNLAPNTKYTATITTGAKDLASNALASSYVWSFTTGAAVIVTPPAVSSTNPANLATGVPFNQKIAATFSEAMDASTITTATFTLMQGSTFVSGTVSYSGTTAVFAPSSNLPANTKYTATITTGAKDLAGNALVSSYVWSFTTGAAAVVTPPTVTSTDPLNAATGVGLNQKVAATFSEGMDASTITAATFTLKQGTTSVSGFVSYSGSTAIFAPSSNLAANLPYTATITTGAKDLAGNALASSYVWNFTTGAAPIVTPPTVSSTNPANLATGVGLNQKVAATFSKTMDPSTITAATFTLTQGTTSVSGFVSYSGTTAIFAPSSNLAPNTTYTATITTGAKDLAGNALASSYVWSFTTGAAVIVTPPTVTSTVPVNAATGVGLNQKVAATFSEAMDASTITTATFTLKQGTTSVSGFVSYSGTTAIFAPSSNLAANTAYTATITTGAQDLAGNALASSYVWSFTTGAAPIVTPPTVTSTVPVNAATGVALNQKVAANFSEAMDASTITAATFTLKQGTTSVSGFVSYAGTTAIFAPSSNLAANLPYTATITTGAQDLAGNALASSYVWSFTTGAAPIVTPPTVTSTDPANLATGVALNQKVAATFSEAMDASTITTATFTLMQGTSFVSGTVSYVDSTATYTPSGNLTPNTTYVATITTGAKDLAGNSLTSNYVWSFTTVIPYTVMLSSNPPAGGTTIGGGTFNSGSSVTVIATPKAGYTFTSWTEGSNVVSTSATYQFTISGNRTLVANFTAVGYIVTLLSNPAAGGNLYGAGTFDPGSSVTVSTTSKPGYKFIAWTEENGTQVSTNAVYTFTITKDTTLVADFGAGQMPVVLGTASQFAILSDQAITNIPTSAITGNVGISPGARSSITGFVLTPDASNTFSTSPEVTGKIFAADDAVPTPAMLIQAKTDALNAYLDAVNAVRGTPTSISGNLNGLTLYPGLYESGSSIQISAGGILYLDAKGDSNAVFVIQSATSITTLSTSAVVLAGNAQAKNVFWSAGSAITLGTNSTMKGTLIASTSISLLTGANLTGRALIQGAAAGQVSLDQGTIVLP